MNKFKKGKIVESPLLKSQIPIPNLPQDFLWMHVNPGTKMRNVLAHAMSEMDNNAHCAVVWSGSGPAVGKVISCAEIMKRQHPEPLHQVNKICYRKVEEVWDPLKEGLDTLVVKKELPTIHILLSKEPVDTSQPGYQPPAQGKANEKRVKDSEQKQSKPLKRWIDCETFESFGLRSARTKGSKRGQRGGSSSSPTQRHKRGSHSQKPYSSGANQRFPKAKQGKFKDNPEAAPSGTK